MSQRVTDNVRESSSGKADDRASARLLQDSGAYDHFDRSSRTKLASADKSVDSGFLDVPPLSFSSDHNGREVSQLSKTPPAGAKDGLAGSDDKKSDAKSSDNRIPTGMSLGPKTLEQEVTNDGGTRTTFADGTRKTTLKDGTVKTEFTDGTDSTRTPSGDGYKETHSGPRKEDNYYLEKTGDGRYKVADKPGSAPVDKTDDAKDLVSQRAQLNDQIENKLDAATASRMKEDMKTFETNAKKNNLGDAEVAQTYQQIGRLMGNNPDAPVSAADRLKAAEQVLHYAGTSVDVDQGYHNTCGLASMEARMYTRNPSAAAKLVADVATTGQFKTKDGSTIQVDPQSMQRDSEAKVSDGAGSGQRSYASQLFEVTAANVYWQRQTALPDTNGGSLTVIGSDGKATLVSSDRVPQGSLRYEQHTPVAGMTPPDTGERLMNYSKNPPEVTHDRGGNDIRQPFVSIDKVTDISNQITGKDETRIALESSQGGSASSIKVGSEQELKNALAGAKADGNLPLLVQVHSGNEPFYTDSGAGAAGGSGGWHLVNITDYDAAAGRVSIDNQWGWSTDRLSGDRRLTTSQMYSALYEKNR